MIEREIKYLVSDFEPYRNNPLLKEAEHRASTFEDNIVFDDKNGTLKREGKLLRLRSSDRVTITFKKPLDKSRFKVMEEYEIDVSNFEEAENIISSLGYIKVFRYQKRREVYIIHGGQVLFDETPIGNYIEIEGSEEHILTLSNSLGLDAERGSSKNYMELYRDYCTKHGTKPADMVFTE